MLPCSSISDLLRALKYLWRALVLQIETKSNGTCTYLFLECKIISMLSGGLDEDMLLLLLLLRQKANKTNAKSIKIYVALHRPFFSRKKEHVKLTWVLQCFFGLGLWTRLGGSDPNVNQPKVTLTK